MWMVGCRGGDVAPVVEDLRYVRFIPSAVRLGSRDENPERYESLGRSTAARALHGLRSLTRSHEPNTFRLSTSVAGSAASRLAAARGQLVDFPRRPVGVRDSQIHMLLAPLS